MNYSLTTAEYWCLEFIGIPRRRIRVISNGF